MEVKMPVVLPESVYVATIPNGDGLKAAPRRLS